VYNYLRVEKDEDRIMVKRIGSINALVSWDNWVVIANPSEVMAHEDKTIVEIHGNLKVTEASFTKVMSDSKVTLEYYVTGEDVVIEMKPLLLYDGASCNVRWKVKSRNLRLIETVVLGRTHHGEVFRKGSLRSVTEVMDQDGMLKVYDTMEIVDQAWMDPNFAGGNVIKTIIDMKNGEPEVIRSVERWYS